MRLTSLVLLSPPFGGLGVAVQPDLVAACKAKLLATPAFVAAVGHANATPKVFFNDALGSPALPYTTLIEEGGEDLPESPQSDGTVNYVGHGSYQFNCYAASPTGARAVRRLAVAALNDAPLLNDDCTVLYFRAVNPTFPVVPDVGPDSAACYRASVNFKAITETSY